MFNDVVHKKNGLLLSQTGKISQNNNFPKKIRGNLQLSIKNISVEYKQTRSFFNRNKFKVIRDISFDVYSGDSIGILGRNGVGKSTLLLLLAGIIKPNRGTIINHGVVVSLLSLGAIFYKELSGRDNIILSGLALGFSKRSILEKVDEIIEFSGIGTHIDRPVRTYSSGMSARLGFSIANILEPDILLIDEVLGVGDKDFRVKSTQAMKEKIKSDQTVVLVSHNVDTIAEVCDRAIWIDNGIIVSEGLVNKVVKKYKEV